MVPDNSKLGFLSLILLIHVKATRMPIYKYYSSRNNGAYFYTQWWDELQGGDTSWSYQGIAFWTSDSDSDGGIPLHRYRIETVYHLYTISDHPEFIYEGIIGYCYQSAISPDMVPLYRYYDATVRHYYTIFLNDVPSTHVFEGVECYVFASTASPTDDPSAFQSAPPTTQPTLDPLTGNPSTLPTTHPSTQSPTDDPSAFPSAHPSQSPLTQPTLHPSQAPILIQTVFPSTHPMETTMQYHSTPPQLDAHHPSVADDIDPMDFITVFFSLLLLVVIACIAVILGIWCKPVNAKRDEVKHVMEPPSNGSITGGTNCNVNSIVDDSTKVDLDDKGNEAMDAARRDAELLYVDMKGETETKGNTKGNWNMEDIEPVNNANAAAGLDEGSEATDVARRDSELMYVQMDHPQETTGGTETNGNVNS